MLLMRGTEGHVFLERGEGWLMTGGFSNVGMDPVGSSRTSLYF